MLEDDGAVLEPPPARQAGHHGLGAGLRAATRPTPRAPADKLSYDLWYLRHRNLTVDLAICAKTFSALLFHPGR